MTAAPGPRTDPGAVALDDVAGAWDAAVAATPEADPFCASSAWAFAAAASFDDVAGPPRLTGDDAGRGLCGLRRHVAAPALLGLDPMWGFATPVVGAPRPAAHALLAGIEAARRDGPVEVVVVVGQRLGSPLAAAVAAAGEAAGLRAFLGPEERRVQVDLADGVDAWWARRSPRFRQRLRRLEREAAEAGVVVEDRRHLAPAEAVGVALEVEDRGWKGAEGTGMAGLTEFYERMLGRLAPSGGVRLLVATVEARPVAYVLGGVRGGTYRGFQLAYADEAADLGLGHLLQLHQVRSCAEEGLGTYDLGMDLEYKHRWGDRVDATTAIVLRP